MNSITGYPLSLLFFKNYSLFPYFHFLNRNNIKYIPNIVNQLYFNKKGKNILTAKSENTM